jgi:membrane-associated protein
MDWIGLLQLGLHFDRHLESVVALYGMAIYVMLFAIVFCEIAFIPLFFLPGDPLLFICGALCAAGSLKLVAGGYFFGHIPIVRDHLSSLVLLGVGLEVGALVVSGTSRYFN